MNFKEFGIFAIVLICWLQAAESKDYCSLCSDHIACNNKNNGNSFGKKCSKDATVADLNEEYILKLHNDLRNALALGRVPNMKSGTKMPILKWDNELAHLAELNARQCVYGHDKCRATKKYPQAGQNIAKRGSTAGFDDANKAASKMIYKWFSEYEDTDHSTIKAYQKSSAKKIGHFTAIANDECKAVGCAMVNYTDGRFKRHYLVCNYGYTNIIGRPVYISGKSASKCKKNHPTYKGLCIEV